MNGVLGCLSFRYVLGGPNDIFSANVLGCPAGTGCDWIIKPYISRLDTSPK